MIHIVGLGEALCCCDTCNTPQPPQPINKLLLKLKLPMASLECLHADLQDTSQRTCAVKKSPKADAPGECHKNEACGPAWQKNSSKPST